MKLLKIIQKKNEVQTNLKNNIMNVLRSRDFICYYTDNTVSLNDRKFFDCVEMRKGNKYKIETYKKVEYLKDNTKKKGICLMLFQLLNSKSYHSLVLDEKNNLEEILIRDLTPVGESIDNNHLENAHKQKEKYLMEHKSATSLKLSPVKLVKRKIVENNESMTNQKQSKIEIEKYTSKIKKLKENLQKMQKKILDLEKENSLLKGKYEQLTSTCKFQENLLMNTFNKDK